MILQLERASLEHRVVVRDSFVAGGPEVGLAVMCEDTIMNHSDVSFFQEVAFTVPLGSFENNVVGLPFAGRAASVDEWWLVTVDR